MAFSLSKETLAQLGKTMGGVLAIMGGLISVLLNVPTLWDRYVGPSVEVVGVVPACVYNRKRIPSPGTDSENPTFANAVGRGISLILHLQNGRQSVLIGGVELAGDLAIGVNDYIGLLREHAVGRSIDSITKQWSTDRPYKQISWFGEPEGQRGAIRLEPHEERFVAFTVSVPDHIIRSTHENTNLDYIGLGGKHPHRPKFKDVHPDWRDFFVIKPGKYTQPPLPSDVREELKDGRIRLLLRVHNETQSIDHGKLLPFQLVNETDWLKESPQRIYFRTRRAAE